MRIKKKFTVDGLQSMTPLQWYLFQSIISELDIPSGPQNGSYHSPEKCGGNFCCFHNPSDHKMRDWPMKIRSTALVERTCPHGVGHPDPDSVDFFIRAGHNSMSVHGCDLSDDGRPCCAE